jgi:type VI secretion system protein ImpG
VHNPYYQDHLSFLIDGGRSLAKAFPRAADRLARRWIDPDVERLLEGIAFISGKIDEKHDQGLPDVCQLMLDILFPHYLCPLPSATILQLEGEAASLPASIPAGTEVESVPILGTGCSFRTIYDVELSSLHLEDVTWRGTNRGALLTLQLSDRAPDSAPPDRLRLYLHGEPLLTRSLFQWLETRLDGIELLDAEGKLASVGRGVKISALGYGEEEELFSHPPGSFPGFRLLQEYFTLPQKFLFVDVEGLRGLLATLPSRARFALRFQLRVDAAHSFGISRQNLRLGCTPAVNIFRHSADPVRRTVGKTDFLVRPAGPHLHYQIYRVTEVEGRSSEGAVRYPLLSELDMEESDGAFGQLHRREIGGEVVTYISLSDGRRPIPLEQTLLIDLLCCNGQIPLGLRVGDHCAIPAPNERLTCSILTPLTPAVSPAVGAALPWRLVAHLTLGQRELTSIEGLRTALTLYNYHAAHDAQVARGLSLLVEGMMHVENELIQHPHRRVPVWGQRTELTMDEAAFDTAGEMYLFGRILNELVALQAPLNFFSEFILRQAKGQEAYRWPKRLGRHLLQSS